MKLLRTSNNEKKRGGFVLFTILFLLVLYLVGTVETTSFHSVLHASINDAELHSQANETNACHQSVYHNKKEQSCEHKSHIVFLKKCPLCHLSFQSFHLYNVKPNVEFAISSKLAKGETHTSIVGDVLTLIPARAPPVS